MILVADSGSTKTSWALVSSPDRVLRTEGLNPHFTSDGRIREVLLQVASFFPLPQPSLHVCFYGAGCGTAEQRDRVARLLAEGLQADCVEVETDLLGACRATCGRCPGVVGILGTGSNCCCYDGSRISFSPPSTGFILGDHGSANHIGRLLLHDYLSGRMPPHVAPLFQEAFPLSRAQFLDAVYQQPNANRFLASLAPFALRSGASDYEASLVRECLHAWYSNQLSACLARSTTRELHLIGGFAAALKDHLISFLEQNGVTVAEILADPLANLCRYHLR